MKPGFVRPTRLGRLSSGEIPTIIDGHIDDALHRRLERVSMRVFDILSSLVDVVAKDERDAAIVKHHMGMIDGVAYTAQALGERYRLPSERVREICGRAIVRAGIRSQATAPLRARLNAVYAEAITEDHLYAFFYYIVGAEYGDMYVNLFLLLLFGRATAARLLEEYGRACEATDPVCRRRLSKRCVDAQRVERRFYRSVTFPGPTTRVSEDDFRRLASPHRVIAAVPPSGGEIQLAHSEEPVDYASRLERNLLLRLDRLPSVLRIKTQSMCIPYRCDGQRKAYHPDILLLTEDHRLIIVEAKPYQHMAHDKTLMKLAVLHEYCMVRGYGYAMVDPRMRTLQDLKTAIFPEEAIGYIDRVLESRGAFTWRDFHGLKKRFPMRASQLFAIAVQRRLRLALAPFFHITRDDAYAQRIQSI